MIFYIAQFLGVFGMLCNVGSYQFRRRSVILFVQSCGAIFFAVHFFMLDAVSGCLLNIIAFFRAISFALDRRVKLPAPLLNGIFIVLYLLSYAAAFLLFQKEPSPFHLVTELLPVIAMIVSTVGFSRGSARAVRIYSAISSPLWLTYNVLSLSIAGACTELFSLSSAILGFLRHDRKKAKGDSTI